MLNDKSILAAMCASRQLYDQVKQVLTEDDLSVQTAPIVAEIDEYYASDVDVVSVNKELLCASLLKRYPKHGKEFETIIKELQHLDSPHNFIKILREYKQHNVGIELAGLLLNPKASSDKIKFTIDNYLNFETEDADNYGVVGRPVSELAKVFNREGLNKLYPKSLNDALGGGVPDHTHIGVIARPECFTKDTEVLTTGGWLSVDKVTETTKIAAVNDDLSINFQSPAGIVVRDDFTHRYNIKNSVVQMELSPGHRVVYTKEGQWAEDTAENIKLVHGKKIHTIATGRGSLQWTPLSALKVAYQADGRTRAYKAHGYTGDNYCYEFTFKKQRKIQRLINILSELPDIEYSTWEDRRGYTGFYVKTSEILMKDFSWVNLADVSQEFAIAFCEELLHWDGKIRHAARGVYCNTNKPAIDVSQAIAVMAGLRTHLGMYIKKGYKPCYELTMRTYVPIDAGSLKKEKIVFSGLMYCFSVSTGRLLIRTHGSVVVSGNTGKTLFGISNACGYARNKHKVLYIGNEDPVDAYLFRIVSRLTELNRQQILSDPDKAAAKADSAGYNNIIFDDEVPCTFPRIEKLIKKHNPKLVIIDQLHQVYMPKADGAPEQLTRATKEARRLCKKYPIVLISFTQAGDSGSNKLVLDMGDTYQSNTSFPGDVDIFIGLGTNEVYTSSNRMMVNLAKNKISGNHTHFPVMIDASVSKVISV